MHRWLLLSIVVLGIFLWGAYSERKLSRGLHDTHSYLQRISSLQYSKQEWNGGNLSSIFSWKFFLPEAQLRKGLVYTGSNFRLRRVIKELIDRRPNNENPIKIAVIGGSISW